MEESTANQSSPSLESQPQPLRKQFKQWAEASRKVVLRTLALPAAIFPGGSDEAVAFLNQSLEFNVERVILNYYAGMYPVGTRQGKIRWENPPDRAVIPLDQFQVPQQLEGDLETSPFEITFDKDVQGVITACAEEGANWLTPPLIDIFIELHRLGLVHSVEAWQDGELAGGAYGTSIGSLFIGESMFSRVDQAGKVALVHLIQQLIAGGYTHIGCQCHSSFWHQFGARSIPCEQFKQILGRCIVTPAAFE